MARSYGPGRYDPSYEEWAVDYPAGYVRWTEGRNLEAALDLMASGRLDVSDLVSHRFPIDSAPEAFELLEDTNADVVGIVLDYDVEALPTAPPTRRTAKTAGSIGVGICGAGLFVRNTILPSLQASGFNDIVHVSSQSGTSAARLAEREGITNSSSGIDELLADESVDLVVVATTHSTHADLTVKALDAGKHVYVEKPLAITDDELATVEDALDRNDGHLHVGFNRRWSPMVQEINRQLAGSGPLNVMYRVNAGPLPKGHWYADRREGGRLLGEVCHFIDTANAIIGTEPTSVSCVGPNDDRHDNYALLIGYADGSAANISYVADAHSGTPKEWCEVTGRGHTVELDDYRRLMLDGSAIKNVSPGKGHAESLRELSRQVKSGASSPTSSLTTTRVALDALAATKKPPRYS